MSLPYVTEEKARRIAEEISKGNIPTPIPSGLEVIQWDGQRNFTQEEFSKLSENKAYVSLYEDPDFYYYYVMHTESESKYIELMNVMVHDDGIENGSVSVIIIDRDGSFGKYSYGFNEIKGTKLYKHTFNKQDYSSYGSNNFEIIMNSNEINFNTVNGFVSGRSIHSGPSTEASNKSGIIFLISLATNVQASVLVPGESAMSTYFLDDTYSHTVTEL